MSADALSIAAPLQVWQAGKFAGMGYVRIEGEAAEAIAAHALMRRLEMGRQRGFRSVKVEAAIGGSRWSTSVFPTKSGGWFMPIKQAVRRAEGLEAGGEVGLRLELV